MNLSLKQKKAPAQGEGESEDREKARSYGKIISQWLRSTRDGQQEGGEERRNHGTVTVTVTEMDNPPGALGGTDAPALVDGADS